MDRIMSHFKTDYVSPDLKFEFVENASEVDGEHILAKVKGVFFCPDGISRNKRFYPRSLWEKALADEEVQQKLRSRTMFGTIGHDTELNDRTLQEGRFSHIVTQAYIDESGRGIGEALILGTPAGKILNTMLRAGCEVFVSSRADGKFKGYKNGLPVVDEDNYSLKGWDFVLSPGFLQANPRIAEAYENITKGEYKMSDSVIAKLSEENATLREKLVLKDVEVRGKIDEAVKPISEENNHVKTQLHEAEDTIAELKESLAAVEEDKTKISEELAKYSELGESFDNIKKALEESHSFMSTVLEKFGTIEEIEEALVVATEMKEAWDAIGQVDEVKAALEIAETLIAEKKANEDAQKANELAEKLNVKAEAVVKLMKKGMSEEEITDILESAKKEELPKDDKPKDGDEEPKDEKKKKNESKDENLGAVDDLNEDKPVRKSRCMRLVEDLNR
jgi:cob(I)alamin adenosyltransferase